MRNDFSVIQVEAIKQEEVQQQQEIATKTEKEWFNEIFMKPRNKRFANGRVFGGYDDDGNYIAHSVSPKFSDFRGQVEDLIYPAVKALVDKGYYTICSCEGHPRRANIKLGFGTVECRDKFIEHLNIFNVPSVYFIKHESCINNTYDGESKKSKRKSYEVVSDGLIADNATAFNIQFSENFHRWYFLDVNLFQHDSWNPFVIFRVKRELKRKNEILDQLASAFLNDSFPTYRKTFGKSMRNALRNNTKVLRG